MFPFRRASLQGLRTFNKFIVEEVKRQVTKKVNQYVLIKKLGSGSTSKVYLAHDCITNNQYAAKMIHLADKRHSGDGAAGLEREIRIMRLLNHPNIIKLHEVLYASQTDTAYLFIEYADCGTVENLISEKIHISDASLASIFKQLATGLLYLHGEGIVHHDVKPSNMMLFSKGLAKLADFGIGHSFTSAEEVIGTPAYQAPELLGDDSSDYEDDPAKEDVWSLGVSLYEAAFGELPYTGNNLYEIVNCILTTPLKIPENNKRSPHLIDLIHKMLQTRQKERITLEDVLKHPFFENASETARIPIPPITIPPINFNHKMNYVSATVCDENYTFAKDLRSFSWPGCVSMQIGDDEEDNSPILASLSQNE
ncbi:Serine/threonine-protein kinase STK11 [Tritrichomonas foetus]|uniref:Serine/threonine-protein kinase STK11 n=1 Tax=Tritrichomonas foetus TaxID=1144522 RepID=A0A1J4JM38_9EUKA|nr:Serine/threonine-protein kinase STK11 [Tritrichomonas foetus]|eukprot:OHS98627.1 Serine/threonine-protein kinase STK11 [Tritrichomonas foetus]